MEEVDDVAVFDLDAFGAAGGTGGVDDVGEVIGGDGDGGVADWLLGDVFGVGGEVEMPGAVVVEQGGGGDHRGGGRVVAHELEPLGREPGIEGQVGGAALERGEHGDDHVETAFEMDADDVTGGDATGDEVVGELVGAVVELTVGERLVGEDDRRGGGGALRLAGDQGVHADVAVVFDAGVVHGAGQLGTFRLGQHRQRTDRLLRIGQRRLQQHHEMVRHPLHRPRLEQIRRILEGGDELPVDLGDQKGEIERRRPPLACHRLDGQPVIVR